MLTIRRYQPYDQQAVWSLHNLALDQVGAHGGNGPWDEDVRRVEATYLADGGEFLVGVLQGRVVAMGALRRRSTEVAEVKRMRVHPEVQRRGFGRAILAALEQRARELGYVQLVLDTTTLQRAAIALYRDHGYVQTGRSTVAGFPTLLFAKRLDPV